MNTHSQPPAPNTPSRLPAPPPRPHYELRPPLAEAAAQPRPRAVAWSAGLWLAAVLAGLASAVLVLLNFDQLRADLLADVTQQFPDETQVTRERVVAAVLAFLIGSGVLIVLMQLGCALAMRSRRRWARVALVPLWLLGAGYSLAVLGGLPWPALIAASVAMGLSAILSTVAAVVMFLPASNSWFAGSSGSSSGSGGAGEES